MHQGCFVWTPTPPLSGRRTPRLGPVCVCMCVLSWPGWAGRPPGRILVRLTFSCGRSCCSLSARPPPGWGCPACVVSWFVFFSSALCAPLVSGVPCFPALGALGLGVLWSFPPLPLVSLFFFPLRVGLFSFSGFFFSLFFFFSVLCWLYSAGLVCRRLSGVLVCVVVGLVLRRGPVCACALLFGAPRLCLALFVFMLFLLCVPGGAVLAALLLPLLPLLAAVWCCSPNPSGASHGGVFFFFASGLCWLCPSLPPVCPVLCFVLRRVVWCCGLWCVLCCVCCCVAWLCSCAVLCSVMFCCCWGASLSCVAAFSPGCCFFSLFLCLSVVLRAVSVSVLCFCGAVLVSLLHCSLCAALLPLRRWLVFCVVVCCVCVLAVVSGCCKTQQLSSVVSWWVRVAPGVVFRWCAVVCPWVPCCAVLLRVVPPGVVWFRYALFGAVVWCVLSLSVVLGTCAFWRCVLSCPAALCVFCCVVSLRGVVRCCALCRVRPGVSCCAFPVLSFLCGVAVGPCSPLVPCSPVLCPVVLCCRVVLWCRVLLLCLVCFLPLFGFSYLSNRCKILLNYFFFFRLKIKKIIHYPTHAHSHTCRQQDHVWFSALHVNPRWWRCRGWHALVVAVSWTCSLGRSTCSEREAKALRVGHGRKGKVHGEKERA